MKVVIKSFPEDIKENTGIGRVVHAQYKYLPEFGVELTRDYSQADLFCGHTNQFDFPRIDILFNHGLYWTGDLGGFYSPANGAINQRILTSIRRARAVTVPSEWVAMPFKRDMHLIPDVIGHGIDYDQWSPGENKGYILWNKNRGNQDVCDPTPAWFLASKGFKVVSTYAPQGKNIPDTMSVTGLLDAVRMKDVIRSCDIYLATTQETFGIGTLEALAAGLPILGYDWGGTRDIVRHKVEGYLVRPGDADSLLEGLQWLRDHRSEVSDACRDRVRAFGWKNVAKKYADLFTRVYSQSTTEEKGVSFVVPCHNYGNYLSECIDSILAQTRPVDEIIIIDDGSTDMTIDVTEKYCLEKRVRVVRQENQGVASARNRGIELATQPFVVCLDADDKVQPTYVEKCLAKISSDRQIGIVYPGLIAFDDTGYSTGVQLHPFDWEKQSIGGVPPYTCIPSGSMFRRDMWVRAGGYRQRYAPGEDTEFWVRGLSRGFTAEVATDEGLFLYRVHKGSASRSLKYSAIDDDKPWMRDGDFPMAAPSKSPTIVRSYSNPAVQVIIEVKTVPSGKISDSIDSVVGQRIRNWEIIVYDSSKRNDVRDLYPFIIYTTSKQEAVSEIRAPFWLILESGNKLKRDAIEYYLNFWSSRREGEGPRLDRIFEKWEGVMPSCCGGKATAVLEAKRALGLLPPETREVTAEPKGSVKVKMEFIGGRVGTVEYRPPGTQRVYRGGNNDENRFCMVDPRDIQWLVRTGVWQEAVSEPTPFPPSPKPEVKPVTTPVAEPPPPPVKQEVAVPAQPRPKVHRRGTTGV